MKCEALHSTSPPIHFKANIVWFVFFVFLFVFLGKFMIKFCLYVNVRLVHLVTF